MAVQVTTYMGHIVAATLQAPELVRFSGLILGCNGLDCRSHNPEKSRVRRFPGPLGVASSKLITYTVCVC